MQEASVSFAERMLDLRQEPPLLCAPLLVATLCLYAPVTHHEFIPCRV